MRLFRSVLFWLHLTAGVIAGIVVVIMSVTGVALTYQRQMQAWADKGEWQAPANADATQRLTVEQIYARLRQAHPDAVPTAVTIKSDANELASAVMSGPMTGAVLVDPYTGAIVQPGPRGAAVRGFFSTMVSWHRYLARTGEARPAGRAVTGASNLLFLFIVLSGLYLWWPRSLRWSSFKPVLWFRRGLPGKARDFNWHNVLGFWSAIPLAIVVASATVISYPWATAFVYRVAGDTPPAPASRPAAGAAGQGGGTARQGGGESGNRGERGERGGGRPAPVERIVANLDAVVAAAQRTTPGWRSISAPLPADANGPIVVTIDRGDGGQPQLRATATIDREQAAIVRLETFSDQSRGRRWRSILRFAHTGEVLGLFGQTIAGIVSAASVVLAYTGFALAFRRLTAWLKRRRRATELVGQGSSSVAT